MSIQKNISNLAWSSRVADRESEGEILNESSIVIRCVRPPLSKLGTRILKIVQSRSMYMKP